MAQPFTGNFTVLTGNATSLLANSTVKFANGTIVANGSTAVYFDTTLVIRVADASTIALVAAQNSAVAANTPFSMGCQGFANLSLSVAPAWLLNAGYTRPDANQTFVAVSANVTGNFSGF